MHQQHFGKKFYQDKIKEYWISTTCPKVRAHVWVWVNINGKIPKGYHIHHIDEDKSNNSIENLELIKGARHLGMHMVKHMLDPNKKKKMQEHCEKIRPLSKEWHKSEEGRSWHRYHAIKNNFGNGPSFKYSCQQCSSQYESKLTSELRTRFCSNACKSKWRRVNKMDDIEKICPCCYQKYFSSKYSRSKTCSRMCGKKYVHK